MSVRIFAPNTTAPNIQVPDVTDSATPSVESRCGAVV